MVDQATTQALPRGAVLAKVGNQFRVVWNLGDGLGYAWYSISPESLKNIYETANPKVDARFSYTNVGQFTRRFGDFYFGNVEEVSLKADTPWQDLTERIESQFGAVPGLDDPEIRRLLRQAYFEGWSENEWVVNYRQTNYFKKSTDTQRAWVGMSQAEKNQVIKETASKMSEDYFRAWGVQKPPEDFLKDAESIASGVTTYNVWQTNQRQKARLSEGTPEFADAQNQQIAANEPENRRENYANFAGDQWRAWVGPVTMPETFSSKWGLWLATGEKSEADLETYLKQISTSRWAYKPPDLSWEDWSASYKSQIKDELELASIDDKDPLLNQVLSTDLTGQDLTSMIRQDRRFLSTNRMYGELSSAAADLGRRFGFIT